MNDLSLVPLDVLLKEAESRCKEFVCAYNPNDFETKEEAMFFFGKGSWHSSCALSNILNNDVLNNWNGELRTLQRINSDE